MCDCCKKLTIATLHEDISVYPKFIIIVLCREIGIAEVNENNINTVNTAVEFPLEELCFLTSTVSNVQEQSAVVNLLYNLIGTVNYKAKSKGVLVGTLLGNCFCYGYSMGTVSWMC